MREFDLRLLPFMRWDLSFDKDESFHGWFARTVGLNGDDSVIHFNLSHDMSPDAFAVEEALSKTSRLPLSDEMLRRLKWATPIRQGKYYNFCGERFRPSDVSFRRPRWCPACIAEKPYRRVWFDIPSLTRCPYHEDPIIDRDIDGSELPWHATDFSRDDQGRPLGRQGGLRSLRIGTFGHYLLGRLGFEERVPAPILDKHELSDVIPLCDYLGREAKAGTDITLDDIDVGFSMACGSHAQLAEALRPLVMRVPGFHAKSTIRECFGRLYATASNTFSANMARILVRAMEEAMSAELRPEGDVIVDRDLSSRRVTTQEVEDRCGVDANSVATIAKVLGIHRLMKRKPLIEFDIPRILEFVENLVDRQAAADYLNISEHAMGALVNAGVVRRFIKLRLGEFNGPRFHVPDLDEVLKTLADLSVTGNVLTSKPFHAYTLSSGLQHGDLAVKVLKGEVRIAGRKPDVHGFRALVIDTGKMNKRPRITADPNWLSVAHVQAILNFRKETVEELMAIGHLVPKGNFVRLFAFKRAEVEEIEENYARSTDICAGLGITKYRLRDLMTTKGVTPLIRSDARGRADTIYNKGEVMKALGLTADPSVCSDPDAVRFWRQLTIVAKRRFPALLFSRRPMAGGHTIGMTTRLSVLVITYHLKTRTAQAVVAPARIGPVFTFNLDDGDWDDDLEVLFDKLLEREGEFMTRRSEYNKAKRRKARG